MAAYRSFTFRFLKEMAATRSFLFRFSQPSVRGWSTHRPEEIHIKDIINVDPVRERMFCIFDSEFPIVLEMTVKNLRTEVGFAPAFTNKGVGGAFYNETKLESIVTRRYKDSLAANIDREWIERRMEQYRRYLEESERKFLDGVEK